MVSKLFKSFLIVGMTTIVISCGQKSASEGPVTGKYIDEFGNKFELREDHSATIQFVGQNNVNETRWYDGAHSDTSYVTIGYNGDSTYYFLSHGKLYRSKEQMEAGSPAIELKRDWHIF